ncbi:MAG: hypothetical protein CSB47_10925, partial [Proteobacteria bacterium]
MKKSWLHFFLVLALLTACSDPSGSDSHGAIPAHMKVGGTAQKGHFAEGSTVTLSQVDAGGNPTGLSRYVQINEENAQWATQVPWTEGTWVEVSGNYFNECTATYSAEPIKLEGFFTGRDSEKLTVNINLFTHLYSKRLRFLLGKGSGGVSASRQAQRELQSLLGFKNDALLLDLYNSHDTNLAEDNANLLLFSSAFGCQDNPGEALEKISQDFADNAQLDGGAEALFQAIASQAVAENFVETIVENLGSQGISSPPVAQALPKWVDVKGNKPPVSDAGLDQSVRAGVDVHLNGSNSQDSDGSISSYSWAVLQVIPSGVDVSLRGADSVNASFTAPLFTGTTRITLQLTVTDDDGLTDTDTTVVTVEPEETASPPSSSQQPNANAGLDVTVVPGVTVTLDGSGSFDSDGSISHYDWVLSSSSPASVSATLNNSNTVTPSFVAPSVSTTAQLLFTLTVTDDDGATATDTVVVTVNPPPNQPPVANAGA